MLTFLGVICQFIVGYNAEESEFHFYEEYFYKRLMKEVTNRAVADDYCTITADRRIIIQPKAEEVVENLFHFI